MRESIESNLFTSIVKMVNYPCIHYAIHQEQIELVLFLII